VDERHRDVKATLHAARVASSDPLMPRWIQHVSDFNPVNWAVTAGRAAISSDPNWGLVASRAGFLAALLAVCLAFATRAFRSYQRSV
jgi:ABC-2 type transport system permease protein